MEKYNNFINGKWIDSEAKEIIKVEDPATAKVIGEISCAKQSEVDLAVSAAKESFNKRILVDMPLLQRAKLMHHIADETRLCAGVSGFDLLYNVTVSSLTFFDLLMSNCSPTNLGPDSRVAMKSIA